MYLILFFGLVAAGLALARFGVIRKQPLLSWGGGALVILTTALFLVLDLWGEVLWFDAVGFADRFWTFVSARAYTAGFGALLALVAIALLATPARRLTPTISPWTEGAAAAGGLLWGLGAWEPTLLFLNRAEAGISEPILGLDAGFYLFTLPFLEALHGLLLWVLIVLVVASLVALGMRLRERASAQGLAGGATGDAAGDTTGNPTGDPTGDISADPAGDRTKQRMALAAAIPSAVLGLLIGTHALLNAFNLLYSQEGVTAGPGWTDVNVRLPAYLLLALLSLGLGLLPLIPKLRSWASAWLGGLWKRLSSAGIQPLPPTSLEPVAVTATTAWGLVIALWVLLAGILPSGFQALAVEPNEITYEEPYIAHNIALTRHAFGLDRVEQRQYPADQGFTRETVEANQHLISEIRLWDWRALDAVYKQFQEIRLYYEFVDVDMDRYQVGDRYRQVMVSAREMSQENLPEQSKTFVNRRFKYTHGYGLTVATVSDFTSEGLPNLLVKDIPPKAEYASLAVERPEIYYGELTWEPVVVNSEEREFDFPRGEQNAYSHYQGTGGVEMRNLWRKFVFGWKLDGTRLLLSGYPRPESRFMIHRQIEERVRTLAPFLTFDQDPYLVLVDGRLKWIIDAYTTSTRFPYSQPFEAPTERGALLVNAPTDPTAAAVQDLDGVNYLRNAVKVVIDAYDGAVDFYSFDADDPILSAWRNALPGMFQPRSAMPEALEQHIRYPEGLLLTQGLVYAKYHMDDPEVFYNQEDLWVRATEKHYGRVQPVEPYYVMWELPGSDQAEFVLMLPFTPKNRQVLIGWIAGLSDGDNYGRFLAYQFPKERRVLGPQQVETKIDQDSYLSGQLSLWDQRGSNVIRGNVLAIPLDDTLLYVEPIYLEAETAAYPELRLVAAMQGDDLSYAETLDEALKGLFGPEQPGAAGATGPPSLQQAGADANDAFERYLEAQGEGRFNEAAEAMSQLQTLLEQLAAWSEPPAGQTSGPTASQAVGQPSNDSSERSSIQGEGG